MLMRQLVLTSYIKKSADEALVAPAECSCAGRVVAAWWCSETGVMQKGTQLLFLFPPSHPQHSNLNSKELVFHLFTSHSSMVRSVKVTLPSASIRMIVLVLKEGGA